MTTYRAPRATIHTESAFPDGGAALRVQYASIVRTQNARTTDGPATGGHPEHEAMTDAELDAALTVLEKHFIDRMDTRRTDPARHAEYADAMRTALTRYADTITRADTVQQPRERHLATTDAERASSHLAIITLFPEAVGLLDVLTDIEGAHAALYGPLTEDATTDYLKALNTTAAVADAADTRYGIAHLNPAAYTAFLLVVTHYTFHRHALAAGGASIDHHADLANALATRLDRARADMAAAFARDRRTAVASYRARTTSVSV
jgi:hypothetical protein